MSYEALKSAVSAVITSNASNEILGQTLRDLLNNNVIPKLGAGQFKGNATPSTNPGTPEGEVYYLASQDGTYSNFGGITLDQEVAYLVYNSSNQWVKERLSFVASSVSAQNTDKGVSGKAVTDFVNNTKTELNNETASKAIVVKNESQVDGDTTFSISGQNQEVSNINAEYVEADNAFRFTGTQRIVRDQALNFSNGGTILLEVKIENWVSNGRMISNSLGFNPAVNGFWFSGTTTGADTRVLAIQAENGDTVISNDMGLSVENTWIKVAVAVNQAGNCTFYLNGTSIGLGASSANNIGVLDSTRDIVLGNLDNAGSFNRPMLGSVRRATIIETELSAYQVGRWNNEELAELPEAVYNVNFSEFTTTKRDAFYFTDEGGINRYRQFVTSGGDLKSERFDTDSQTWVEWTFPRDLSSTINGIETNHFELDAEYVEAEEAFRFTGTQQISSSQALNFTNGATILLEMKAESFDGTERIISNGLGFNPTLDGFFISVTASSGQKKIAVQALTNVYTVSAVIPDADIDNVWAKLAVVISSTGVVTFFLNGQTLAVETANAIGIVNSSRPVVLGNLDNNGDYNRPFEGSLRRATIYQKVLNQEQVQSWNDNELEVNTATYHTDFRNQATVNNQLALKALVESELINGVKTLHTDINAEYVAGDEAFRFTGDQRIESNQPLNFTNGATILMEIKPENYGGTQRIMSNSDGFNPATDGFNLIASTSSQLAIQAVNSTFAVSNSLSAPVNTWVKVAITITSGGTVAFFENGSSIGLSTNNNIGIVNSNRVFMLGNINNGGSYNRAFEGSIRRVTIYESVKNAGEIEQWNNNTLETDSAAYHTDFRDDVQAVQEVREVFENLNPAIPFQLKTDGWGTGINSPSVAALTNSDFQYINTGVDLLGQGAAPFDDASVGEAFHGLAVWKEWLVQPPQDHHSIVCYNTQTGEVKEIDCTSYVRAIPSSGNNFRDKFNGATADPDGIHVWVAPSWTTHALKVNMNTFTIAADYLVNPNRDDSYNGIIVTDKYVWCVTHSKEDIARITKSDGTITFIPITEPTAGDYNMNQASVANNRSFLGGSNGGDGHVWFHPRRSRYLIKIEEATGNIVARYRHPLADETNPNSGYFHGASRAGNKIYFTPFNFKNIIIFDIATEEWKNIAITLTHRAGDSGGYSFASTFDGRYIYYPPFRCEELIKVDTFTDIVYTVNAAAAIDAYIAGKTRSTGGTVATDGFSGGCAFLDGCVWFSSSFESCYVRIPVKELGSPDTRSQGRVMARESVHTQSGYVYFGHENFRMYSDGTTLKIQYWNGSGWSDSTSGTFTKS